MGETETPQFDHTYSVRTEPPRQDGENEDVEMSEITPLDEVDGKEALDDQERAFDSLSSFTQHISDTKSPESSRHFLARLSEIVAEAAHSPSGKLSLESLKSLEIEMDKIPDLKEIQEKAHQVLEEMGVISQSPEGIIIANLDEIKSIRHDRIMKLRQVFASKYYGKMQIIPTLYYCFKDCHVISKDDYEQGVREGKTLFYSPSSSEEAFDVDAIKQADFYLGFWESTSFAKSGQAYPSTEDQTNFTEVALACMIYHPQYGNGFRGPDGRLLVYDHEKQEYRTASGTNLFRGNLGLKGGAYINPAEYVVANLPSLNRFGLLTPEDFKKLPSLGAERPYFVKRKVPHRGSVMIDKVSYYIGRQKEFRASDVYKISDTLAVMCENGKVTHTFPLRSLDDPELEEHQYYKGELHTRRTNKDTTNLTVYSDELFSQQRPDESENDFEERTRSVENFKVWLKLDALLGDEGLTTFRQMEFDPELAKTILSLEGALDDALVSEIVKNYQVFIRSVRETGNFIRSNLGADQNDEKTVQNVVRNLMRKGLNLLLGYAENPPSSEQIEQEMAELQSEVTLFASTFKEIKKEEKEISLEDFRKFQVEATHGSQLDPEMQETMLKTLIQNRLDRPDIIDQARVEFQEAISSPNNTFYILKYAGNLVGFFRMDRQGELDAYLGSLNVPPHIQGSGIGDETLRNYFITALNGRIGHASADPRNPITPYYIGRYNFVGTAIKPFGDTDRPFIEMRLDQELNSKLKYFNASNETITANYHGNEYRAGDDPIILRFAEADLDAQMSQSNEILSSGRYVMSAFRKIKNVEGNIDVYLVYEIIPGQNISFLEVA